MVYLSCAWPATNELRMNHQKIDTISFMVYSVDPLEESQRA